LLHGGQEQGRYKYLVGHCLESCFGRGKEATDSFSDRSAIRDDGVSGSVKHADEDTPSWFAECRIITLNDAAFWDIARKDWIWLYELRGGFGWLRANSLSTDATKWCIARSHFGERTG